MKKNNFILAIIWLIIFFVAVLTNPNQEKHKEALKYKINKSMQQGITSKNSGINQTGQVFATLVGGAVIDRMIDSIISSDNYLLFSTTKITWNGKTEIIGVGIFGNVILFKNLDDVFSR